MFIAFYIHLIRESFGIIINKLDDIIEKIYNLISNVLPNVEVEGDSFFGVGYPAYYIIICVIVFLLSGWMADKKLSV